MIFTRLKTNAPNCGFENYFDQDDADYDDVDDADDGRGRGHLAPLALPQSSGSPLTMNLVITITIIINIIIIIIITTTIIITMMMIK